MDFPIPAREESQSEIDILAFSLCSYLSNLPVAELIEF